MTSFLRRFTACLLLVLTLISVSGPANVSAAESEESSRQEATNISSLKYLPRCEGFPYHGYFFDGQVLYGGKSSASGAYFTAEHPEGVGSVYIIFEYEYGPIRVTNHDTGEIKIMGEHAHLHEFLDLEKAFGIAPSAVTLEFISGVAQVNEVYLFTPGQVPDFVQRWEEPVNNETDLILFSTHGDDEHLFFAGVLPYYGVERDYQVQVVYLTDHRNNKKERKHEMLNGLWAIGMQTYPVFGEYDDFLCKNLNDTFRVFANLGWSHEHMLGFVVEQIRRFKPKVVVAHDFEGEYGHGQHMVYAQLVAEALEITNDPMQYPELAETYGTWDVPKAYFHLYEENQIVMDWDQPLKSFGGQTAFEVSVYTGFQKHKSQINDFAWYYAGYPNAISLPKHNPCYYGLYRTTVGPDVDKNDFFENVTAYIEDKVLEAERLEQERLEQERQEQETAPSLPPDTQPVTQPSAETQAPDTVPAGENNPDDLTIGLLLCITVSIVISTVFVLVSRRKPAKAKK